MRLGCKAGWCGMNRVWVVLVLCIGFMACAAAPVSESRAFDVQALSGRWVMANGPAEGREYRAAVQGDQLVVVTTVATPCLRANEKAFFGTQVGNQLHGKFYVCLSGGNQTVRDLVISIQDADTLIARVADSGMPDVRFERIL